MKKMICLIVIGCFVPSAFGGLSFDDITTWAGSGSNRAGMIVHWSAPEVFNNTSVPAPIADVAMAWGYYHDGTASGWDMMTALAVADSHFYVVGGSGVVAGIGYDLDGDGEYGLTDGATTYTQADFTDGILYPPSDVDSFIPTDSGDLYWGGWMGPNWELWHEDGGNGGFTTAPDRGSDTYWTNTGTGWNYGFEGYHGQWDFSGAGISGISLEDGSWVGWSVAAGGLEYGNDTAPGTIAWYEHKQAPVPEPATMALLGLSVLMLRRKRQG
jgi:hypothetical protein